MPEDRPTVEVPTALETNVLPVTRIVVKREGGQEEYQLVLDYNAIAKAQAHPELSQREIPQKDGSTSLERRDLSQVLHWAGLTGPDLTIIAWAALDRFHPGVELRTVRQWLAPAQADTLFVMLMEQCYPGVLERSAKAMEEMEKKSQVAPQVQEPAAPLPEMDEPATPQP